MFARITERILITDIISSQIKEDESYKTRYE